MADVSNTTHSGKAEFIREYNRWLVANLLRREGPLSRADLAARLGLSAPAVSRIVETLIREGCVAEVGVAVTPVGRRPRMLAIRAEAGSALAVDLRRVTRVEVGLVDIMGNLQASRAEKLASLESAQVVETIARLAAQILGEAEGALPVPLAVGMACPGVVNFGEGRIEYSAHLGWRDVPIKDMLENKLGMRAFVDTDCNAPALAESWLGAGARANHARAWTRHRDGDQRQRLPGRRGCRRRAGAHRSAGRERAKVPLRSDRLRGDVSVR